jgi:hypothetical protein
MHIDAQGIENMIITFIICYYGVENKPISRKQKSKKNPKTHLSIPFEAKFRLKSILVKGETISRP